MGTPLTKQQRHECYKIALSAYYDGRSYGICGCLRISLNSISFDRDDYVEVRGIFPELEIYRINNGLRSSGFWWHTSDSKSRIECLKFLIEQTKED